MQKKSVLILSSFIIIALIAAAFIILDKSKETVKVPAASSVGSKVEETEKPAAASPVPMAETPGPLKTENIEVHNNSLEYDLKASLVESASKETTLTLEYYSDGAGVVKAVDKTMVPELEGIFKRRETQQAGTGNSIRSLYLHAKYARIYFMIEGGSKDTAVYSFNMKDSSVKKLWAEKGTCTDLAFSRNMKYAAFSCANGTDAEKALLQVIRCEDDEMLVNKNRTAKGLPLGGQKDAATDTGYAFLSWQSSTTARLKGLANPMNSGDGRKQGEIPYDVEKDVFLNPDGSVMSGGEGTAKPGEGQTKAESDAVKTLREFYLYITTDQYSKAYEILDDRFRLNAFKLLGVSELSKADIDVNTFSMYGSIFKTARLESVVGEKTEGGTAVVYFYQSFAMGESDEVRQALVASLRKTDKGWKVAEVSDGVESQVPFKK